MQTWICSSNSMVDLAAVVIISKRMNEKGHHQVVFTMDSGQHTSWALPDEETANKVLYELAKHLEPIDICSLVGS